MQGWWAVSYVALWALVLVLGVLVVALARQIGTLHLRLGPRGALEMDGEGPALGDAPPPADAEDVNGRVVRIGGPGESQALLFVSPSCPLCREVLPGLAPAARDFAPYVISSATEAEAGSAPRELGPGVPFLPSPELVADYEVPGTPFLMVLDEAGAVAAKGTINNLEQMEGLIDTARRRIREQAAGHSVHEPIDPQMAARKAG
jgi:methylamine dehydrogenase accessory protein MauD